MLRLALEALGSRTVIQLKWIFVYVYIHKNTLIKKKSILLHAQEEEEEEEEEEELEEDAVERMRNDLNEVYDDDTNRLEAVQVSHINPFLSDYHIWQHIS